MRIVTEPSRSQVNQLCSAPDIMSSVNLFAIGSDPALVAWAELVVVRMRTILRYGC